MAVRTPELRGDYSPGQSWEREKQEKKRQTILDFLVESGRANSLEEAERHWQTINTIKGKLVEYVREEIPKQERYSSSDFPSIQYRGEKAQPTDLEGITAEQIDKTDPELWKLERRIDSHLPEDDPGVNGIWMQDRLQVRLSQGPDVEIYPDFAGQGQMTFLQLSKSLTAEDLAFLKKEYVFAAKDLERRLHAVADEVAAYRKPTGSWKNFSEPVKER